MKTRPAVHLVLMTAALAADWLLLFLNHVAGSVQVSQIDRCLLPLALRIVRSHLQYPIQQPCGVCVAGWLGAGLGGEVESIFPAPLSGHLHSTEGQWSPESSLPAAPQRSTMVTNQCGLSPTPDGAALFPQTVPPGVLTAWPPPPATASWISSCWETKLTARSSN